MADRLAAFGGAIALNREVDRETAELIAETYAEVVVAPEFAPGVMDVFAKWKNLRVMRIANMARLRTFVGARVRRLQEPDRRRHRGADVVRAEDARTARTSCPPQAPAQGQGVPRQRGSPRPTELDDLLFGWLVETGITSNSVIYVKDGATVGIGTGEQDRVGRGRDRPRQGLPQAGRPALPGRRFQTPYASLAKPEAQGRDRPGGRRGRRAASRARCMVSDGFFPFRDGVDVGHPRRGHRDRPARAARTGTSSPSRPATRRASPWSSPASAASSTSARRGPMPLIDMPLEELKTYTGRNPRPADFDAYWDRALAEMRAVDPKVELVPHAIERDAWRRVLRPVLHRRARRAHPREVPAAAPGARRAEAPRRAAVPRLLGQQRATGRTS